LNKVSAWLDYSEGELCFVWTPVRLSFLRTGKTLCHVLDLFSSCGLCSIYSVSNEHFYGFQAEKTENKRHFLFFSCTFRKVHWSSDFCCCFSQVVASAKPWMVKHAFGFSYVTWRTSYIDVILADFVHDYCGTTAGMLQVFSAGDAKWKCFRRNESKSIFVEGRRLWPLGPRPMGIQACCEKEDW
jgi:hypothetical protein